MSSARLQNRRSIYTNKLNFYTLAMNNQKWNEGNNSFVIASKRMQCFRNKLVKKHERHTENYKTLLKKVQENLNGKTSFVNGLEDKIVNRAILPKLI